VTLAGHLPTVFADPASLRLVFFHLIENALTFNDKPRPLIEVGGLPSSDGAHLFYVRDNGIGIEPKHWERIFHAFQRLHTEEAFPGRGMGLALCKRIIEAHGGRIWVESTPGVGSTFSFTLPMAGGDQVVEAPPDSAVLQESAEAAPLEKRDQALSQT
jgi:light-regulated signal transduction histidine kinase (bacteriophytochrome)